MIERKKSFSIPIGQSKRIVLLNGTKEVWGTTPDPDAQNIIDITITEVTKN
jgi:hypothetical protein